MTIWMVTLPRNDTYKEWHSIWMWFIKHDVKKWVFGLEKGRFGYKHWQIRFKSDLKFEDLKVMYPTGHIEEASDSWSYETKEGVYWKSTDRPENRAQRFGKLNEAQEGVIRALQSTNDREVVLWYDSTGKKGKSWLTRALWERGQAYFIVADSNVKTIVQDVACEYIKNGWRPYVIIDIPRAGRWTTELYEAIERIKDGLIKDPRYSSESINISGVKVLVNSNSLPELDNLSKDRWKIYPFCTTGKPIPTKKTRKKKTDVGGSEPR